MRPTPYPSPRKLPSRQSLPPPSDPSYTSDLSDPDHQRLDFLFRLDAAFFEITDWEARFLERFLVNPAPFTDPQRKLVDQLRTKYEGRL